VTQTPQVYLDHQLYEQSGELHFSWDVAKDYFAPGSIDSLFESYCRFLERAATDAELWEGERWELDAAILIMDTTRTPGEGTRP
jgi:non-ribosomal peptide synthetase component F